MLIWKLRRVYYGWMNRIFLFVDSTFPNVLELLIKCNIDRKIRRIRHIANEHTDGFLFITDTHWGLNDKKSIYWMKRISEKTLIHKLFFGGDFITNSETTKEKAIDLGSEFSSELSKCSKNVYFLVGNHDDNSYEQQNNNAILKKDDIERIFYSGTSKSGYKEYYDFNFFVDDESKHTRYICLNTALGRSGGGQCEQEKWITNVLKSTPSDYHIIGLAHIWLVWNSDKRKYEPTHQTKSILDIFCAYNRRDSYNDFDFCDDKGSVDLLIGGHVHNDFYTDEYEIPMVLVDCDCAAKSCSKHRPIVNTISQQCISAFVLNYKAHRADLIRVGRGRSKRIRLEKTYE